MIRVGFLRSGTRLVLALIGLHTVAAAQPVLFDPPLSPRTANYQIDVRLDALTRGLHASQVLTWHNQSPDTIAELQFHLYLNAFRNNRTTLFQEGAGWRTGDFAEDDGWGMIEISRIATPGGEELTETAEFIWPDREDEHDRSVLRLPLPEAVAPGDSIVLEMDFDAILPSPPYRTGSKEEFFFVGQWYPKVGVYAGGAWNCHQFHASSEFFSDFGVYDIRMTVPDDHILGATGVEVDVQNNGDGTSTHYYHAEDVSDFAWTCSPDFVVFVSDTQDVEIRVLMQRDRIARSRRYMQSAKVGVAYLQDWLGDYPYPNLTVVDPRRGAAMAGGMEYATLYTTAGSYGAPEGLRFTETTNYHEMAHQYFQHMVASNEFEEAWLDEGFAAYLEDRIARSVYGQGSMIDYFGIRVDNRHMFRGALSDGGNYDQLARRTWESYSDGIGAVNNYYKMALMLQTLEGYLGDEVMQQILRAYFERWRFKHPTTRDLIDVVNEFAGEDLTWFFDQLLFTHGELDYSISRARAKKIKDPEGFDFTEVPFETDQDEAAADEDSGTVVVAIEDSLAGGDGEGDAGDEEDGEEEPVWYRNEVKVRRLGSLVFPVVVELKFDDGEVIREQWDGRETWRKYVYVRESKLESATVDPDFLVTLDINFTNNSRFVEPEGLGVKKLCARIMFWAQFLMDQPEFLNVATLLGGVRPE